MKVHTHHLRGAIGTRDHFDWSANGDGLRELEPAEPQSIVGTGTQYLPAMGMVLTFLLVGML